MKKTFTIFMPALVVAVLTVIISGCTANRVDLVDTGAVTIEKQASEKVYVAWANAYEDGDGFVVTGVLKRRNTTGQPIKAYVDVTVLSPDDAVISTASSPNVYVSRHVAGRGGSPCRFKVHLPRVPPANSIVRVTVHSG